MCQLVEDESMGESPNDRDQLIATYAWPWDFIPPADSRFRAGHANAANFRTRRPKVGMWTSP